MKFRKIPVVVDAFHFENVRQVEGLIAFVGQENIEGHTNTEDPNDPIPLYYIKTLEGDMRVSEGDWIIKGVKGEFYPCKPDVFAKTYEIAEDSDASAEATDPEGFGNKYRVLDAKTGEDKPGRYFCLRIDAKNPDERAIVRTALHAYACMHKDAGNAEYAKNVLKFIGEEG